MKGELGCKLKGIHIGKPGVASLDGKLYQDIKFDDENGDFLYFVGDNDVPRLFEDALKEYYKDLSKNNTDPVSDIDFLKKLQIDLKGQDNDGQAAPRFWAVGDYRNAECSEGNADEMYVCMPNADLYGILKDIIKEISDNERDDFSEEQMEDFDDINGDESALEWLVEHYDEDAYLVPIREEHFVCPDTMFITKREAKAHIEANRHHYTSRAHTYAMTAWRSPVVSRLFDILENFDWDSIEEKKQEKKEEKSNGIQALFLRSFKRRNRQGKKS